MPRVALACNVIRPEMLRGRPLDAIAELDSEETIARMVTAVMTILPYGS